MYMELFGPRIYKRKDNYINLSHLKHLKFVLYLGQLPLVLIQSQNILFEFVLLPKLQFCHM